MCSKVETEYKDIVAKNDWAMVYTVLQRETNLRSVTSIEAVKAQNKPLNRYRDVHPYDHSRVVLRRTPNDYINANIVKVERANRQYILTQGPMAYTICDFWVMVWEQNCTSILMLNKVVEKGEVKCYWYWPREVGPEHKLEMPDFKLTVEQTATEDFNYYTTRTFSLCDLESNETRQVKQFHYTTWPDFGVPSSPVMFLDFLKYVRASGAFDPDSGPPIVHCSAGIGRSGTFCLVDSCLELMEKTGVDGVSVREVLLEMRQGRMGLVQNYQQLRFSYEAIIQGLRALYPDRDVTGSTEGMEGSIYSTVCEEEEDIPPPPPPRGESLIGEATSKPPQRPLPSIPISVSMQELPPLPDAQEDPYVISCEESCSCSDEHSSHDDFENDEDDDTGNELAIEKAEVPVASEVPAASEESAPVPEEASVLRQRRKLDMQERVAGMKRRAHEAERWHRVKRSFYKPLTITFGVLVAGVIVYACIKH